jgi:glycosyltransferase involved in cell wall biosynthesis
MTIIKKALRIGYIWQYETHGIPLVSATALHIQSVIQGLERRGHKVQLVAIRNSRPHYTNDWQNWIPIETKGQQRTALRIAERIIRGIQSRLNLPYLNLFESYRFAQACTSALQDCDVLYERFWLLGSGGAIASNKLGLPLIYEVNGDLVEEYNQLGIELSKSQWAAINLFTRLMFNQSAKVITVSDTLKSQTISRWQVDPSKVAVVYNGANVDLITQPHLSATIISNYGINNGSQVVIFVSSFKPWHGLDLLVKAFHLVATQNDSARLLLVGDGILRQDIEVQVKQMGLTDKVIFTGAVEQTDVAALLNLADVAVINPRVSPASQSQCPLKLFEYMAAGKAIVAPAIPTIEHILDHRANGFLIAPDNHQVLSEAIIELLNNRQLRSELGIAAQQKALQKHSWDHTVSEIEEIFYSELSRKSNGR